MATTLAPAPAPAPAGGASGPLRASVGHTLVAHEARSLLARLVRVRPFALTETMVPAASVSVPAQAAIERHLIEQRRALRDELRAFANWAAGPDAAAERAEVVHRRFALMRIRFNVLLSHLDVFSEVMTQRSEHETGVLLAGLDIVAADALALPGRYFEPPPLICYLQRGQGAAIRRARTRLPGGGESPVGIIRVPRERMVGSGIASSLVHEVGHQGAALLDLVTSVRGALVREGARGGRDAAAWATWGRWVSEIVADFWSVAKVGVASTLGLMGVVALPRAFVFRHTPDDPHPIPWIRVKLSAAMGDALYPHPQWGALADTWESFYPVDRAAAPIGGTLAALERTVPRMAALLVEHQAPSLGGRALGEVLGAPDRRADRLTALFAAWRARPNTLRDAPPTLAFAAVGQAKLEGRIAPETESDLLTKLLTHWALRATVDAREICASVPLRAVKAPIT